ncbi:MAG TPA: protease inhibitor I42 family protein [Methanocella sp.]
MKDTKDRLLSILVIAFVVFACAGLAAAYVISGNSGMKVFDGRNHTQTITIKNGETFKVVLDENPGTGYGWIINVTPGLTIVNDTFVPSSSGLTGAGGRHEWQIKVAGTGNQQLSGIYKRSWETDSGNEATYRLNITIV